MAFGFQVLHFTLPTRSLFSSAFNLLIAQLRQIHSYFSLRFRCFCQLQQIHSQFLTTTTNSRSLSDHFATHGPAQTSTPKEHSSLSQDTQLLTVHTVFCSQFGETETEELSSRGFSAQRWSGVHSAPVTHCWNLSELQNLLILSFTIPN